VWCRKKLIKTKGEAGTPSESDRLGWEGRCPTRRGPREVELGKMVKPEIGPGESARQWAEADWRV